MNTIRQLFKNRTNMFLVLLATALSFTPLYALSYLLFCYMGAKHMRPSRIFQSQMSRIILNILLLAATVMAVGMVLWLIRTPLHPIIILLSFGALLYLLGRLCPADPRSSSQTFDRSDLVSTISASVILLFIVMSFYFPKPQDSATFQIITNGYDNMAHVTLLTTDAKENGYVYGFTKDVGHKTISPLGAYPQGWHLTTSHIMNGFGANLLEPTKPLVVANAYLVVLAVWYFITVYIASRVSWRLLEDKITKKDLKKNDTIIVFLLASLLIQLLIYWGSLLFGFASYFGSLAYIVLLAALIIDKDKTNQKAYLLAAGIATLAAAQSWILPLPAMLGSILFGFFWKKEMSFSLSSLLKRPSRQAVFSLICFFIAIFGGLFQVGILLYFNSVGATSAQLVNDGGIFWTSSMLVGVIFLFTFVYWLRSRKNFSDILLACVLPIVLLSAAIFVYQMLTVEATSYYFVKTLGLAICIIGIFFIPAFVDLVIKLKQGAHYPLAGSMIAAAILVTLVIGTGQNLLNFSGFMQRNSKVTSETAEVIVQYLRTVDNTKNQLVVLRDESFEEDSLGSYLANRLSHRPSVCSGMTKSREQPLDDKFARLQRCMKNSKDHFTVITSDKTHQKTVKRFGNSITYINVP